MDLHNTTRSYAAYRVSELQGTLTSHHYTLVAYCEAYTLLACMPKTSSQISYPHITQKFFQQSFVYT